MALSSGVTWFKCLALITQEAVVSLLAAMVGFQRSPQPCRVRSRLQAGCDRSTTPSCFAALSASERRRSGGVGSRPGLRIVLAYGPLVYSLVRGPALSTKYLSVLSSLSHFGCCRAHHAVTPRDGLCLARGKRLSFQKLTASLAPQ